MFLISFAGQYLRTHCNVTLFLKTCHALTSNCGTAVIVAIKLVVKHLNIFGSKGISSTRKENKFPIPLVNLQLHKKGRDL